MFKYRVFVVSEADTKGKKKFFSSLKKKKGSRGRKPNKSKSMPHLIDLRMNNNGTQHTNTDHVHFPHLAKGSTEDAGALQATSQPGEAGSVVECTASDVSPGSTVSNLLVILSKS